MADRLTMVIGGVMIVTGMVAIGISSIAGDPSVVGVVIGVVMIGCGVVVLGTERIAETLSDRFPTHERKR